MNVPFLDLQRIHAPLKKRFLDAFGIAIDTNVFVGGDACTAFEEEFASLTQTAHCVGVASGTDALRLGLQALGIGPGNRVLTVPNTFIATTEAISMVGATIDFVDVDPATDLMDPERLSAFLKKRFDSGSPDLRPSALIPVHLYGQCADMEAIHTIAERYEMKVIEDAAQAHGASCNQKSAGSFGDVAAFSFYPGKNLGALGEGGACTTNDPSLAERIAILRDHGQSEKYHHMFEGSNGRLHAIQAAMLAIKLPYLLDWNRERQVIAERYDTAFADSPTICPVVVRPMNISAHHLYVIHAQNRDALMKYCQERGVGVGLHYPQSLHLQPCYAKLGRWRKGDFPHAEESARTCLSLPIFPGMRSDEVEYVIDTVLSFRGTP